jgi:hypothetical protein
VELWYIQKTYDSPSDTEPSKAKGPIIVSTPLSKVNSILHLFSSHPVFPASYIMRVKPHRIPIPSKMYSITHGAEEIAPKASISRKSSPPLMSSVSATIAHCPWQMLPFMTYLPYKDSYLAS